MHSLLDPKTHRHAFYILIACTLMWSIGGPITRFVETAPGFERTLWRSIFCAATVAAMVALASGTAGFKRMRQGGVTLWVTGFCWGVMFSCFMVALSLTTVANVLLTQSLAPVLTALLSRVVLKRSIPARQWAVIAIASSGVALMYVLDVSALGGKHILGVLVAAGVPVAVAVNLVFLQIHQTKTAAAKAADADAPPDLSTSVLLGSLFSIAMMLPLALPLQATAHDVGLMALLGVVQLGVPCVLMVRAARHLSAPEVSLLGLLEVIFGLVWAWIFAGETPGTMTLIGGAMVLGALATNELWALREQVEQGA